MSRNAQNRRLALLADKQPGQLLIHEIYKSVQGESSYAGLPCVFVRVAVCDARCVWCDTPHAFNEGKARALEEVLAEVLAIDCPLVEVTGGEPLLQVEALSLMTQLAEAGRKVLLETSGAHDVAPIDERVHIVMDIKCPDSGEQPRNRMANLDALKSSDELKFVIMSRADFDWAERLCRKHKLCERFGVLFSAVFDAVKPHELAGWLLASGLRARFQLQLHKYVWDPKTRGV